ncbi:hypothetical protein Y032_0003g1469 [Ancylostoma ceylanicum]|uniref:Uncharacterized protein n=1 Tax=Ancylostoma ceylanicum TaxID=53326 RepID=A0A016VY31_9BILA|nr:hypothetical protein Y032_0003g1469 [Ancylostoma ceylanicum]
MGCDASLRFPEKISFQLPQPSLSSILDVLNILNGIIIISVANVPSAVETPEAAETKPTTESLGMTDEALD